MCSISVYDFRFMGSAGIVFGITWVSVGISMLYGLIKVSVWWIA